MAAGRSRHSSGVSYAVIGVQGGRVLEKLDDDLAPMAWRDLLKDKKREWVERLKARVVTP
jgi:hypothetical protein